MKSDQAASEQYLNDRVFIQILLQMLTLAGYPPRSGAWFELRDKAMAELHQMSAETCVDFINSLPEKEHNLLKKYLL